MSFEPKFRLLPHIQRQIKAIENTTGFLEAVRFREDWIQEVRAQTHVEDALASVQIEGSSVTLEQAFALSGQLPDRDLSDAEREFTNYPTGGRESSEAGVGLPQRKMLSLWKIRSVSLAPIHYSGQKTHTEAALKRHVGPVDSVGGVLDVEEEQFIWEGHPSHKKDLSFYVCCALLSWLIVPILVAGWRYLETKHRVYLLTSERLRVSHGVLSKRMDELELYRVKDTSVEEPFWFRVFGLGNIIIETSDRSTPQVTLFAIPEARMLRESIRGAVEKRKDAKGVREVDFAQA